MKRTVLLRIALVTLLAFTFAACAPAPAATPAPPATVAMPTAAAVPTQAPVPTTAPTTAATVPATTAPTTTAAAASPTSIRSTLAGKSGCNLILSTTTSTADSGLLTAILPAFETKYNCKVNVVAVGTGQAIVNGQKGDADVLLVHDRKAEDQFVADGHAKERLDVMYNDFILVGPKNDPAKVSGTPMAKDAFKAIADAKATFASRGDKSGTHTKELSVWASLSITPTKDLAWYNSLGETMGNTLLFANEKNAYVLTDRATWLAFQSKVSGLVVVVGGNNIKENADKNLYNPYGVMVVDPVKHPGVNSEMATNFGKWITSVDEQKAINGFGVDKYGQQLFYANSKEYLQSQTSTAAATPAPTGAATAASTLAPTGAATAASTPAPTGSATTTGGTTGASGAALTITGAVAKAQSLSLDDIKKLNVVTITAEHPKNGKQTYTGVRLNALLDLAQIKPAATKLVLTASDGFVTELTVADVSKCTDCMLAINAKNQLDAAMPNMASSAWAKSVIKIEAK